jgi:hypothetical protein
LSRSDKLAQPIVSDHVRSFGKKIKHRERIICSDSAFIDWGKGAAGKSAFSAGLHFVHGSATLLRAAITL